MWQSQEPNPGVSCFKPSPQLYKKHQSPPNPISLSKFPVDEAFLSGGYIIEKSQCDLRANRCVTACWKLEATDRQGAATSPVLVVAPPLLVVQPGRGALFSLGPRSQLPVFCLALGLSL